MADDHPQGLRHHFVDLAQQSQAARFGVWLFIISELMLFGGMFTGYVVYRSVHPEAFALGSNELNVWAGTINTVVLLLSSFTVVVALHYGREGRQRQLRLFIVLTILLGAVFLGIKGWEYWHKIHVGHVPGTGFHWAGDFAHPEYIQQFFGFYWIMTATHALHMLGGMGVWAGIWVLSRRGHYTRHYHSQIETAGLYWHFVDIVWIFLFPLLYLIGRHL